MGAARSGAGVRVQGQWLVEGDVDPMRSVSWLMAAPGVHPTSTTPALGQVTHTTPPLTGWGLTFKAPAFTSLLPSARPSLPWSPSMLLWKTTTAAAVPCPSPRLSTWRSMGVSSPWARSTHARSRWATPQGIPFIPKLPHTHLFFHYNYLFAPKSSFFPPKYPF